MPMDCGVVRGVGWGHDDELMSHFRLTVSDSDSQMIEESGRDTLRYSGIVQNIMIH
jgi:hypothetical protein